MTGISNLDIPHDECPIWGTSAVVHRHGPITYLVDSLRAGGAYAIDIETAHFLASEDEKTKARLTSALVKQRMFGNKTPVVTHELLSAARMQQALPVYERAERLLHCLAMSIPLGSEASPADEMFAFSESITSKEVITLFRYLRDHNWVEGDFYMVDTIGEVRVTIDGYSKVESIVKQPDSSQAFIAMWLGDDPSVEEAYKKGIMPAIQDAGYTALRIDEKLDVEKIDDAIIAEIRRSRFVVADFTHGDNGIRGSVYYEAGFAQGLSIPVIYSCRKDQIDQLHFDTRQYYHIAWERPEDLREGLKIRILASIGEGPQARTI